jgi:hypothetical protein
MSHSRSSTGFELDPLKIALGVFVVLGLALTALAGYAVLSTVGNGVVLSAQLVSPLLFGLLLLATAAAVYRASPRRVHP